MDYRQVIESKYNRQNWQSLLYDIFRKEVTFWTQPQPITLTDTNTAKNALYLGKITLSDGHVIAIYEVELSDSVIIERNRASIRNLLCTNWRGMGCAGAFMFCFRKTEAVLRFSYVSESFTFAEDGSLKKESTDTKRFTYLLGEGHRSRTAIEQFKTLQKSNHTLKDVTKAFSVEALSDLFFKDYKTHYENIIEFITGKRMVKVANKWEEKITGKPCREIMQEFKQFRDAEKAVRDYVKKLMGRLVFLQFLQKKGWMGCSAGEAWNDGDKEFLQNLFTHSTHKDTFVDDVLEPLFSDINTKRKGDLVSSTNVGNNIKIPYLNGGLFEKDEFDHTSFPLPAKFMKNMLDFFASYNFTIDENDPDDAEIGVDPEMLGRIFENLLEDNKDKGAFYTPKEIVQYMCRESLTAYLQTDIEDDATKKAVRTFVTTHDVSNLPKELKATIDQKLKDVKICDPAIGSGAFPMGLLRELYACRKAIEGIDDDTAVSIKTHIIQNNIYGVDIEKGAVDIARLRFWLALIVDEKNPHALPNMDFKIMQGNSLLEQYEGIDLSGMSINELEEKKAKERKSKKSLLQSHAWQQQFVFDEQDALKNIQNAIKEYYLTDEHDKKTYLRSVINDNVRSYILNIKGFTPEIKEKLEDLPIPNDKFFLWHIYFKEVFDRGGFDIVIANPPYIDSESMTNQGMGDLRNILKRKYVCLEGNWDIYMAFLELALSMSRIVVFITPDKWLSKPFGKKFREVQMRDRMKIITRAGSKIFENATVDAIITLFNATAQKLNVNEFLIKDNTVKIASKGKHSIKEIQDPFIIDYLFADNIDVITKMDRQSGRIIHLAECEGACATADAYKLKPLIRNAETKNFRDDYMVINTGTISKYYNRWGMSPMKYLGNSYLFPVVNKKDFAENFGNTYVARARRPKVIFKGLNLLDVCLDEEAKILPAKTTNVICSEDITLLKFLCGLLNSKLIFYYIKLKYSSSSYCGGISFTKDMINYLPVNTSSDRRPIINVVEKILKAKRINPLADTDILEKEIDKLVYKLYDLAPEEIDLVEGTIK